MSLRATTNVFFVIAPRMHCVVMCTRTSSYMLSYVVQGIFIRSVSLCCVVLCCVVVRCGAQRDAHVGFGIWDCNSRIVCNSKQSSWLFPGPSSAPRPASASRVAPSTLMKAPRPWRASALKLKSREVHTKGSILHMHEQ